MTATLLPTDLPEWVAMIAALFAVVQAVYAPRRDLGPMTIGLGGSALMLSLPAGSAYVAIALTVSLAIAAAAWTRAGRHGVGRPALNGAALATVAICGLVSLWLPDVAPSLDLQRVLDVLLMPCLLVTVVGGVLALERPGPRRTRVHWIGKIAIEEPEEREKPEKPDRGTAETQNTTSP